MCDFELPCAGECMGVSDYECKDECEGEWPRCLQMWR